jgi:hypothetical protein
MNQPARPRAVLFCHAESRLNREAVARWLASFTELAGVVLIEETHTHLRQRVAREVKRVGVLRFLDVLVCRLYYRAFVAAADTAWLDRRLQELPYPPLPPSVEFLSTADPNSEEVESFLRRLEPDLAIARCKRILRERIFSIPRCGTFVLHPGVCPEYRNAHGAFWALVQRDLANVGLTLLKIDRGVDTGPVYGYFTYDFDEAAESHIVIMARLALDNLDGIRDRLLGVLKGDVLPIDTTNRMSRVWGQPWFTAYLKWKASARRKHARAVARVS